MATTTAATRTIKVAIVQYEPQLMERQRNMDAVASMLQSLSATDGLDILMLSEMAFTGYCFRDRAEVEPLAEFPSNGATFTWCQHQARRLQCLVACGYVEKTDSVADGSPLFNAMMVVGPDGALVYNYRKTNLYETDKSWATPGAGFGDWFCPWLNVHLSFGICMDINPHNFEAAYDAYEFATSVVAAQSSLILFSSAWTDHNPGETNPTAMPTMQYWANRLKPVIDVANDTNRACYFICSNRTGIERGTAFVGGSCILSLRKPSIVVAANRFDQVVLVSTLPL
ncbi:hypothetical protein LEN26_008495 [Aphanomyces euteiches]|nr:hypothetical protein AeMF1_005355 [Aphanomyces euteiches]KAH9130468.1 hypothetical protein LEN26_008495 [Aphanomyces euteiches]KAH9187267.1 hypothetical protein AeNC1_010758 [Aphanomyces euteiches]